MHAAGHRALALLNMDTALLALVDELASALRGRGWTMASAESCTGGLIAAACTELSGSSDWFERGFVTYSNAAKTELLGVDAGLIEAHGAVSAEVARAMADGALAHSPADFARSNRRGFSSHSTRPSVPASG